MIRAVLEPVLARLGRATVRSAPTSLERVAGHTAYLAGLLLLMWVGAGLAGRPVPVGIGTVLAMTGLGAGLGFLIFLWAVQFRPVAPEPWFVSHLWWLTATYALVFAAIAIGTFGLVLLLFLAAAIPSLAGVMAYAPVAGGVLLAIWVAWRMLRGYWAYCRGTAVGHLVAEEIR